MVFISDTDIFGGTDSPKKQEKKKTTLVVKRRLMIILEVNIRKKVSCVFKIILNVYSSHIQYLITEYLCLYFSCRKCVLANLRLSIFKIFWGSMPWRDQKFSAMKQREFWGLNSSAPLIIPFRCPWNKIIDKRNVQWKAGLMNLNFETKFLNLG